MAGIPPSPSESSMLNYELHDLKETQSTMRLRPDQEALPMDGPRPSVPWRTGILTRFPFWGFGSWWLSITFTIAGVLVLVFSDGVHVDNWDSRLQPTVWLALTSTLTGALLAHAFTEAAAISWWRKATGPTSLEELHNTYQSSNNLIVALWNLVRMRTKIIGLASIVMTLSAIRGPLMQRASSMANVYKTTVGTLDLHIAQELPDDYAAIMTGRIKDVSLLTRNFSDIAQAYSNRQAMTVFNTTCQNCTSSAKAFGFKVNCTTMQRPFNIDPADNLSSAMNGSGLFQVNITDYREPETWHTKDGSFLRLTTLFKDTNECKGQLSIQTCDLHGGITKIPFKMDKDKASLIGTWKDDEFLETRYMYPLGMKDANIIGGFHKVISSIYGSTVYMSFAAARGWNIRTSGLPATQYMTQNGSSPSCADTWSNPMEDLIEVARELGFRASLKYAHTNTSTVQQVEYESEAIVLVYVTDYSKLAIAVVVSLVGTFAVLPVFWGWWELGRNVTMNPLEIAGAFERMSSEGSIFKGTDPNADAGSMFKHGRSIDKIRYGALDGENGVRLGFSRAETIRRPGEGERFVY